MSEGNTKKIKGKFAKLRWELALDQRRTSHKNEGMASPTSREHACEAGCRAEPCPVPSPRVLLGVFLHVFAVLELPFRTNLLEYVLGMIPVLSCWSYPFEHMCSYMCLGCFLCSPCWSYPFEDMCLTMCLLCFVCLLCWSCLFE